MKHLIFLIFILLSLPSLGQKMSDEEWNTAKFTENVFHITEVMFHDVVNPPAAARFYSYAMLSAYQVVNEKKNVYPALSLILKDFPSGNPKPSAKVDENFSAIYAMLETGKNIIPSGYSLVEKQKLLYKEYLKRGIKKSVLDSSVLFAERISKKVADYSKTDGYFKLSTLQRYQPKGTDSTWYPTPPEYMAAVEPNWSTVRTFFLDSCSQFEPKSPVYYSKDTASAFCKLMNEVYTITKKLTPEQVLIAQYWDCNPFANFYVGHVSVGIKKISPAGHWMSITGIACKKAKVGIDKTIQTHALISMVLHDGFISCWDSKYKTHRVRPKTAINSLIDEKWSPLLETPPFPEYTSGHSVISRASAEVLSHLIGANFSFIDNTEVFFGLPERKFESFYQASDEAAISRLYGGIHFKDAIEEGQKQGAAVGKYALEKYFGKMN